MKASFQADFSNWRNLVPTTTWQMIGHALLSTNFNTFLSHLPRWSCGRVLAKIVQWLRHLPHKLEVLGSNPSRGGSTFSIFKDFFWKQPIGNKLQLGISLQSLEEKGKGWLVIIHVQQTNFNHSVDILRVFLCIAWGIILAKVFW